MANSRNTAKVILRNQTLTTKGTATLALQVFVGGIRKLISLGIYVKPEHFNSDTFQVKIQGDVVQTRNINALIQKKLSRANELFFQAEFNGEVLTMQRFMQFFDTKNSSASFSDFVNTEITQLIGSVDGDTIGHYRLMLRYAQEFAGVDNLSFAHIDRVFIEGFDKFLKNKPLSVNSVAKMHTKLKKFINLAILRGKSLQSPYASFKVKKAKTLRDWLTPDELDALFNLYNSQQLRAEWQRVLRYFLFSCVGGGLRISDLKELTEANKIGENLVVDTEKGSNYERRVIIPFSEVGLSLWKDKMYQKQSKKIFDCISDQRSNDVVKKVVRIAGIDKSITMHAARHTFATNYIIIGGRIEMLNDILGHSKLETTQIYLHLAEAYVQKGEQMKNFDKYYKVEKRKIIATQHKII